MLLSAQERAAIINIAGAWALESVKNADSNELANLAQKAGGLAKNDLLIASFTDHYDALLDTLSDM